MQFILDKMPFIIFIAIGINCLLPVFIFNFTTYRLASKITKIKASEGSEWVLFGDFKGYMIFLFSPNDLINDSDSPPVIEAKQKLIKHRMTANKVLIRTFLRIIPILGLGIGLIFMAEAAFGYYQ